MLCPKCKNTVDGNWCSYCGTRLLDDETKVIPVQDMGKTDYKNTDAPCRDEKYNSDSNDTGSTEFNPEDSLNPYGDYYNDSYSGGNGKAKLVVVIIIFTLVLLLAGLMLFKFVFSGKDKKPNIPANVVTDVQQQEDNKVKTLTKKAERSLNMGDYKEAEDLYFELGELTKDTQVQIIYEILYNYNRAAKNIDDGDYKNALKFYEKIPEEYVDYTIAYDIDDLYDVLKKAEKASLTLDEIEACIENKDYIGAGELIDTVDKKYLTQVEKQWLEDLIKEVEALKEEFNKEEEQKASGYGYLSEEDAEILIYTYCSDMVAAINNGDFSIVAPCIYSGSSLYSQQNELVNSCVSQGITQNFESLTLNTLTQIEENKWEARVTEQETIYYADSTDKFKTFNWTYTIEYISGQFFVTGIK